MNSKVTRTGTLAAVGIAPLAALLLAGCPPPELEDPPTGAELFTIISETDPYEAWGAFPDAPGEIQASPPHGPLAQVYVNDIALAAVDNFTGELPNGSIIVKESFDEDMEVSGDGIAVMWKVDGYNPSNNDWFWASFRSNGDVLEEGRAASCIACHRSVRSNDFVFLQQFTTQ